MKGTKDIMDIKTHEVVEVAAAGKSVQFNKKFAIAALVTVVAVVAVTAVVAKVRKSKVVVDVVDADTDI